MSFLSLVDGQYTDGCVELDGYGGKSCADTQFCHDMVNEVLGQPATIDGECSCQDGFSLISGSCVSECLPSYYVHKKIFGFGVVHPHKKGKKLSKE